MGPGCNLGPMGRGLQPSREWGSWEGGGFDGPPLPIHQCAPARLYFFRILPDPEKITLE